MADGHATASARPERAAISSESLSSAIPLGLSQDGAHVFVLMEMSGDDWDDLMAYQGRRADLEDGDADEEDDPAGGNCEDEGEPSCGWANTGPQGTLSNGSSLHDECEPSLGSLSGMMNQERWAEVGKLSNGWPAGHDTEHEHDGREPDVEDEDEHDREMDYAELGV